MNIFNSSANKRPKKNKFDLSHERKMSLQMGTLTPFLLQEIMPGDSFRVQTELLMRLQPLLAPMYHRVRVKTDYFFVPNRLVWDNWQKFITGGDNGAAKPAHPIYKITQADVTAGITERGTLWDYLGLPTMERNETLTGNLKVNCLPFKMYQLIYNEYYRDQNLIDEIRIDKGDGEDNALRYVELRSR